MRAAASNPADQEIIRQDDTAHLSSMMSDRQIDAELRSEAKDTNSGVLNLTIDSMDAAKFRVPRNLSSPKEFEKLWRPELTFASSRSHSTSWTRTLQRTATITLLSRSIHEALQNLQ